MTADAALNMVMMLSEERQGESRSPPPLDSTSRFLSVLDRKQSAEAIEPKHKGFREDYVLGEILRCPSHMIAPRSTEQVIRAIISLKKHDFAFVKRSNGSFSYAILANKTDEAMVFVMSESGATKKIQKRYWCDFVRQPRPERQQSLKELFAHLYQEDAPHARHVGPFILGTTT